MEQSTTLLGTHKLKDKNFHTTMTLFCLFIVMNFIFFIIKNIVRTMKRVLLTIFLLLILGCESEKIMKPISENQEKISIIEEKRNIESNTDEFRTTKAIKNNTFKRTCFVFDDFKNNDNKWRMVNDGVMGGLSKGSYTINNDVLTVRGNINTNGGGFSSIRSEIPNELLSEYSKVFLKVKSDERNYKITLRDKNNRGVSHQANIPIPNTNSWHELEIEFATLIPTYFGRKVNAEDFRKKEGREIGFILSDGIDGPFEIQVEFIKFCK